MLDVKIAGGIGGVAIVALFYSSTLGLLTIIGLMGAVIFDLWQDLMKAEASAKISSGQAKDAIRKESAQKTELAAIATVQKEANALIQQMKLDHKKEKDTLMEKITELEKRKSPPSTASETISISSKAEQELSSQLAQALRNLEQIKRQKQEEQEKSKERLLSLEQQLREALAKESAHKDELERILVLAIQEKKAVAEAKDEVIEKQQQALQTLAKERDKLVNDSLNERQEVIAEAIRERNVLEGQKDELEKIVHSLQADSGETKGTSVASPLTQSE